MPKRKALTIYLDPEDHLYLSDLAASQGTSMSGALRRLLRTMRLSETGTVADYVMVQRDGASDVLSDASTSFYTADTTSSHGNPVPNNSEQFQGKRLLQRLLSDLANERNSFDSVSLGELLDQSRKQWIAENGIHNFNLLDALLTDRSEDTP